MRKSIQESTKYSMPVKEQDDAAFFSILPIPWRFQHVEMTSLDTIWNRDGWSGV